MNNLLRISRPALAAVAVTAAVAIIGAVAEPAFAAEATSATTTPNTQYQKEKMDCTTGRTAEDKATCLKEAGAAQADAKRNQLDNNGSPSQNAADRCNQLPTKDKADCLARIQGPKTNQHVTTTGSVSGGGVLKETTTTTPGQVIVIPGTAASAASASN